MVQNKLFRGKKKKVVVFEPQREFILNNYFDLSSVTYFSPDVRSSKAGSFTDLSHCLGRVD